MLKNTGLFLLLLFKATIITTYKLNSGREQYQIVLFLFHLFLYLGQTFHSCKSNVLFGNIFGFWPQKTQQKYLLDYSQIILLCLKKYNLEKLFCIWEKKLHLVGEKYRKENITSTLHKQISGSSHICMENCYLQKGNSGYRFNLQLKWCSD